MRQGFGAMRIGIIGGSGLGDELAKVGGRDVLAIETPYGPPSAPLELTQWEDIEVVFLSRHGAGHTLSPSVVPYRANIWALKKAGVSAIIASGATGSLREDIEPGDLVLCDQVIDKTYRRAGTFFDDGIVAHIELADPFCPSLRKLLMEAGKAAACQVHHAGTYVCMEGPQFSTRAESHMHRQWGGDLIGMTCMPEAKLAREAEICYAMVALPTDYDCWRPTDPARGHDELLREILGNLHRAVQNALTLIRAAVKLMPQWESSCGCADALKLAIWSNKDRLPPQVRERLAPIAGRYFPAGK